MTLPSFALSKARAAGDGGKRCVRWLLLGLSLSLAAPAQAAPRVLAIADLPAFASALIAEAEGFYAAEGLDLKIIHCVNGLRCLKHLLDGEAQLATVADTPIVMAVHGGAKFDIIATIAVARHNRFVARADKGIRSLADLKGKRIGYVKGTSGHYFTDTFLLMNGIDQSAVTMVPLSATEVVDSLVNGDIDAAGLYQPHGYLAMQRLGANAVQPASSRAYPVTLNLVASVGPSRIADAELVKVLRALRHANRFIEQQPERARALIAAKLKLDATLLAAIWGDKDFAVELSQPLITTLEAESRWAVREGLVSQRAMPDFLDMIKPAALQSLDRRAVTLIK